MLAIAATRLLGGLLFGIDALDHLTFLGVPLVLGAAALLAASLPAGRASRVDSSALRAECRSREGPRTAGGIACTTCHACNYSMQYTDPPFPTRSIVPSGSAPDASR